MVRTGGGTTEFLPQQTEVLPVSITRWWRDDPIAQMAPLVEISLKMPRRTLGRPPEILLEQTA